MSFQCLLLVNCIVRSGAHGKIFNRVLSSFLLELDQEEAPGIGAGGRKQRLQMPIPLVKLPYVFVPTTYTFPMVPEEP